MTLPGYWSTGEQILQDALTRAAAGERVYAGVVLDQLDRELAAHMGVISTAVEQKPGPIITALQSVGYHTPHEVLAAATAIVGAAVALMPPDDGRRWVDTVFRVANKARR